MHVVQDAFSRPPHHFAGSKLQLLDICDQYTVNKIKKAYEEDDWCLVFIRNSKQPDHQIDDVNTSFKVSSYIFQNGLVLWIASNDSRIYVPNDEELRKYVIEVNHVSGHAGTNKTYSKCARFLYWHKMDKVKAKFLRMCSECWKSIIANLKPVGLFQPLQIPNKSWEVVTTDVLTELLNCDKGYDSLLVIVDKLSKRAIFTSSKKRIPLKM